MSDRNWEQELAKIDKQMASVSDEELLAQSAQQAAPQRAPLATNAAKPAPPAAKAAGQTLTPNVVPSGRSWIAWAQLTVAIAAGVGLWFWPWTTRCGLNAIAFTAATGGVTLLGLWSAVGSWRHRRSYAHVLSFAVMIWGLVLGAREILPRMGYAIPTYDRPAGWGCEAPSGLPGAQPNLPAPQVPAPQPNNGPVTNPPENGKS
ncbi:MAG: hypothetical protein H7Z40_12125 [Phycisphaerae bacterium]|nr:hypothetical protein [Gemmatimonadaceae bacterium]